MRQRPGDRHSRGGRRGNEGLVAAFGPPDARALTETAVPRATGIGGIPARVAKSPAPVAILTIDRFALRYDQLDSHERYNHERADRECC